MDELPSKRPIGRPTEYKPEYCEMMIEHMTKGLSFETFGAVIDIAKSNLYEWVEKYPEFQDAKNRAFAKCQLFWEGAGIEGLWGSPQSGFFNDRVWSFNMKNRFKWADKIEVSQDESKPFKLAYDPIRPKTNKKI